MNYQKIISGILASVMLASTLSAGTPNFDFGSGKNIDPRLKIVSPKWGSSRSGNQVSVAIQVNSQFNLERLKARLNGKDISDHLQPSGCRGQVCTSSGSVTVQDGLREGRNLLFVSVRGEHGRALDVKKGFFSFHSHEQPVEDTPVTYYEPASVGFSTVGGGGGGGPWINVTTGNKQDITDSYVGFPTLLGDSNQPVAPSAPYPDRVFAADCGGTAGYTYQTIVLDRTQPSVKLAGSCSNTVSDMKDDINEQLMSQGKPTMDDANGRQNYLVVFATTPKNFALQGLDTSYFGGTDYTKLWTNPLYPTYYIMIGVPGAPAGSAWESTLTKVDADQDYQSLAGTMVLDDSGFYNYVPSTETLFHVVSGSQPQVQIGWQTYTPPANSSGKFWLLVLDRKALQPVNQNAGTIQTDCGWAVASQSCGSLFDVRSDGGAALAATLGSVGPRDLVILTTNGCPADNNTQYSSALGDALQAIGGMRYTLDYLTSSSNKCGYALMSVNDGNHQWFTSNAALSASVFAPQGHHGALQGFLAPDHSGLFDIAQKAQMQLKDDNFVDTVDYTFENVTSQARQDWPLTDTPGNLAAYHDVSYQLLQAIGTTGSHNFDVRFFYTADEADLLNYSKTSVVNQLPDGPNSLQKSAWDPATDAEFRAARLQIATELDQVEHAKAYLIHGPSTPGLQDYLSGAQGKILQDASNVASDIAEDVTKAQNKLVDANTSNWMNFAAGVTSVVGALGGFVNPEVGVFFGSVSGMLWTGSAGVTPLGPETIPGPATPYDITLNDLSSAATDYAAKMLTGYNAAVDNILTDPTKLGKVGNLTKATGNGWHIDNLADGGALSKAFSTGAKQALWMQALPAAYGLRVAIAKDSNNPATFGSNVFDEMTQKWYCASVYAKGAVSEVPAASMIADLHIGDGANTKWDVNLIAEGQTSSSGSGAEDLPMTSELATLLTTDQSVTVNGKQQDGINIPPMMLLKSAPLTYSSIAYFNPDSSKYCDAD